MGTGPEGTIHPFYLTSDNAGGYGTKSDYEARMEEIYGGLSTDRDGLPVPAIMGRLCEWPAQRCKETIERATREGCTALSEGAALRRAEGQSAQQSAQQMCTTDMRAAAEPRWDYADCDLRASPRSLHRASG